VRPEIRPPYQPSHSIESQFREVHRWPRCGVWPAAICYLTASTHYDPGTLIPECNGLSQFGEDTGEPSIPVWELISACPLVQSCWKPPSRPGFELWLARVCRPSDQQALWPINSKSLPFKTTATQMRQPDSSQKLHQTIGLLPPAEFREAFGQMSVGIVYAGIQFCQTAHSVACNVACNTSSWWQSCWLVIFWQATASSASSWSSTKCHCRY